MGTALLMAFISYLYLQWPMLIYPVKIFMLICFVLFAARFLFHLYLITDEGKKDFWNSERQDNYQAFSVKFEERRKNSRIMLKKLAIITAIVSTIWSLIPSQKTLGTVVAIGAATYVTHEVVTSDVVQNFIKVVTLQSNEYLEEKLKQLSAPNPDEAK
jgi:hypothetical protein